MAYTLTECLWAPGMWILRRKPRYPVPGAEEMWLVAGKCTKGVWIMGNYLDDLDELEEELEDEGEVPPCEVVVACRGTGGEVVGVRNPVYGDGDRWYLWYNGRRKLWEMWVRRSGVEVGSDGDGADSRRWAGAQLEGAWGWSRGDYSCRVCQARLAERDWPLKGKTICWVMVLHKEPPVAGLREGEVVEGEVVEMVLPTKLRPTATDPWQGDVDTRVYTRGKGKK